MKMAVAGLVAAVGLWTMGVAWAHHPGSDEAPIPPTPIPVDSQQFDSGPEKGHGLEIVNGIGVMIIRAAPLSDVDDRTDHVHDNISTAINHINDELNTGKKVEGFKVIEDAANVSIFWEKLRLISLVDEDVKPYETPGGPAVTKTLVAQYWRALLDDAVFMSLAGEAPTEAVKFPPCDLLTTLFSGAKDRSNGLPPAPGDILEASHQSLQPAQLKEVKELPFAIPAGFTGDDGPSEHTNLHPPKPSPKALAPVAPVKSGVSPALFAIPIVLVILMGVFMVSRNREEKLANLKGTNWLNVTLEGLDSKDNVQQSITYHLGNKRSIHFNGAAGGEHVFELGGLGRLINRGGELFFQSGMHDDQVAVHEGQVIKVDAPGGPFPVRIAQVHTMVEPPVETTATV